MKKAFTLAEMLVCLALISAVVVIFLSTIKARPNSNMVMFRKAYNITSNSVYEMLQSAVNYETGDLKEDANKPTEKKINNEYPKGDTKFCKVFAYYVNTGTEPNCSGNGPHFTTLDGIDWYMPMGTFSSGKETIRVDVNGKDNLPNCAPSDSCPNPDIFEIVIDNEGKLSVPNEVARSYLQTTKKISK